MQLPTLTPSDIPALALAVGRSGLALMLYGSPGIGKTSILQELGAHPEVLAWSSAAFGRDLHDLPVVTLSAPELNVEDLLGVPTVEDLLRTLPDGTSRAFKVTRWALPALFDPTRPFVLFIDEPNRCEPAVRNALFQLITGRTTTAGFSLPPGSLVVMAGNRLDDRAGVRALDTAFNNRCAHFELTVDPEAWLLWTARQEGFSTLVRAFIARHSSHLCRFDPASAAPQQPTPRTWGALGLSLETAPQAHRGGLVEAFVGSECAQLFRAFSKQQNVVPTLDELLHHPDRVSLPERGNLDHAWILAVALADFLTRPTLKADPLEVGRAVGELLGRLASHDFEEVVTFSLRRAYRALQAGKVPQDRFMAAVRSLSRNPQFQGFMTAVLKEGAA